MSTDHSTLEAGSAPNAVAEVDDLRGEGARLDELEIHPLLGLREVGDAAAHENRVDPDPVFVDQTQGGHLGGESRSADRDVAFPRLGSQPLDFLGEAAGGDAG